MRVIRLVGSFVAFAFGSSAASAAGLLEVFQMSEQHDPELRAAIYEYEAARESVPQAKANLFPDLRFSYEVMETDQDIKSTDNDVFASGSTDFSTDTLELVLTQPIFRFGDWQALKQSLPGSRRP